MVGEPGREWIYFIICVLTETGCHLCPHEYKLHIESINQSWRFELVWREAFTFEVLTPQSSLKVKTYCYDFVAVIRNFLGCVFKCILKD